MHSSRANAQQRMAMERCLTQNFLLKYGMNFFGKRDLIYIDMRGDQDVALSNTWDTLGPNFVKELKAEEKAAADAEKAAKAAAKGGDDEDGGDDGDDDAGEDDE